MVRAKSAHVSDAFVNKNRRPNTDQWNVYIPEANEEGKKRSKC